MALVGVDIHYRQPEGEVWWRLQVTQGDFLTVSENDRKVRICVSNK